MRGMAPTIFSGLPSSQSLTRWWICSAPNGRFVFGLGAPQTIERSLAAPNPALIWGIIIVFAGIFVLFGIFARRRNIPVYIIGILVYLADLVLSILAGDMVGAVVHVVFTVLLVMGLIAIRKLKDLPSAWPKSSKMRVWITILKRGYVLHFPRAVNCLLTFIVK